MECAKSINDHLNFENSRLDMVNKMCPTVYESDGSVKSFFPAVQNGKGTIPSEPSTSTTCSALSFQGIAPFGYDNYLGLPFSSLSPMRFDRLPASMSTADVIQHHGAFLSQSPWIYDPKFFYGFPNGNFLQGNDPAKSLYSRQCFSDLQAIHCAYSFLPNLIPPNSMMSFVRSYFPHFGQLSPQTHAPNLNSHPMASPWYTPYASSRANSLYTVPNTSTDSAPPLVTHTVEDRVKKRRLSFCKGSVSSLDEDNGEEVVFEKYTSASDVEHSFTNILASTHATPVSSTADSTVGSQKSGVGVQKKSSNHEYFPAHCNHSETHLVSLATSINPIPVSYPTKQKFTENSLTPPLHMSASPSTSLYFNFPFSQAQNSFKKCGGVSSSRPVDEESSLSPFCSTLNSSYHISENSTTFTKNGDMGNQKTETLFHVFSQFDSIQEMPQEKMLLTGEKKSLPGKPLCSAVVQSTAPNDSSLNSRENSITPHHYFSNISKHETVVPSHFTEDSHEWNLQKTSTLCLTDTHSQSSETTQPLREFLKKEENIIKNDLTCQSGVFPNSSSVCSSQPNTTNCETKPSWTSSNVPSISEENDLKDSNESASVVELAPSEPSEDTQDMTLIRKAVSLHTPIEGHVAVPLGLGLVKVYDGIFVEEHKLKQRQLDVLLTRFLPAVCSELSFPFSLYKSLFRTMLESALEVYSRSWNDVSRSQSDMIKRVESKFLQCTETTTILVRCTAMLCAALDHFILDWLSQLQFLGDSVPIPPSKKPVYNKLVFKFFEPDILARRNHRVQAISGLFCTLSDIIVGGSNLFSPPLCPSKETCEESHDL